MSLKGILKEFKDFAVKGNAVDMAIGVVIGAAFGKVVTAIIEIFLNPFWSLCPSWSPAEPALLAASSALWACWSNSC